MYTVHVQVKGVAPILQHAYPATQLKPAETTTRRTGATDYSMEWMDTMYTTTDGKLYQPASHIEGAMVKAAAGFKIKGGKGKTWKDAIKAYAYVNPDEPIHMRDGVPVDAPDATLMTAPTPFLSVDIQRVIVQRSAVARSRLKIAAGWELAFTIEVHDEQVTPSALKEILEEAGRAVGLGDYRPRYGRFSVERFAVQ